jgi:hypothetical protein
MTPLSKASAKRAEISVGRVVAIATLCSAIVSGAVAWTVVRFTLAEAKPLAVVAPEKPSPPAEMPRWTPTILPPPVETEVVQSSQNPVAAPVSMPVAMMLSTAAIANDAVAAMQEQYDTNPFFKNRDTLKGLLDSIQKNAGQLQGLVASQASADEVTAKARSMDAALQKAITRLDQLAVKDTERDQAEAPISLALKAKLEEVRAGLPPL